MYLKKFIYVNWGNIPNQEFEFGPINLLSGGNGSGKTTAADAIQTVMTAAHENLFQYNPGQDETTQRGRGGKRVRTLASYVLGCDDGSFARLDTTDGYLAAVFHPTQGETAEPFTAVIGVRAWIERSAQNAVARQDPALFMLIPGEQLGLSHFQREDKGGQYIVALERIHTLLITGDGNIEGLGKRRVEKYDTKKAYLRRLYALLRARSDSVTEQEAMAAARAFSRFMAYKPVQGINNFVAEEILERRDLGEAIRSVAAQLKTIHGMERDAARLIESIEKLEEARLHATLYVENWIELQVLDYTLAQHVFLSRQRDYLKARKEQGEYKKALESNAKEAAVARERREQIHDQLVALEAQRLGVDALRQKDELEQQRERQTGALGGLARDLLVQDAQLSDNTAHSRIIAEGLRVPGLQEALPAVFDLNSAALAAQVLSLGEREGVDLPALIGRDLLNDLRPLERYLDQAREAQALHNQWVAHWHEAEAGQGSLRDALARQSHKRESRYEQLTAQRRQKLQEIERLQAHQTSYPAYVERALAEIQRQCPGADPRVLCDHVEVKDPRWQAAIEGYLGGARFSILVEPAFEAEAIRIVRGLPGRDNRARIVQGEKARRDAERLSLDADSIVHVLDFSHATARHYLMASYGNVMRVDSAEQLRHTRRGLTDDGMAAGNYSMWRCDIPDAELVFGAAARERALEAKREELAGLEREWQTANDIMQESVRLLAAVNGLKPLSHGDAIGEMLSVHRELQKIENLLDQLDLDEYKDLEARLEVLREEFRQWDAREGALHKESGELQEKLRKTRERCESLSAQQEQTQAEVDACESRLRASAVEWPALDCEARLDSAEREARELNVPVAQNRRHETESLLRHHERRFDATVQAHNQQCRPADAIFYEGFEGETDARQFSALCAVLRDVDRIFNQLKNNILAEKHQQLLQLKESFNSAFVTHLCHAIHQAISDGKRQIEQLNEELQHHRFGADRETFRFHSDWIAEFRDYARFFEEVIKNPKLGDGATLFDAELSPKSAKVRDTLMAMLLDEHEHKALRELERIADYRNYRRYEIFKEVEGKPPIALSEYGTGSGGQLETPAYIIRSAAITSAFRFNEGQNHLRMVLVDEAFSKMDETRSREVIGYLTESLGLQLVFIMPTSKCGPFMDLISNEFVFAKCPSERVRGELKTRVIVDRKTCNREKIQALWARHRRTVRQQVELDFMDEVGV